MSTSYRFRIADSYSRDDLPMERLAEYMAAFARLLGEPANVHFDEVHEGSAVLVARIDNPAPTESARTYSRLAGRRGTPGGIAGIWRP